jgi:hypothetical protein
MARIKINSYVSSKSVRIFIDVLLSLQSETQIGTIVNDFQTFALGNNTIYNRYMEILLREINVDS